MPIDENYREVPERIAEWYRRWPDGRIECEVIELNEDRVTMKALVYRTQDDTPAGVGHSFMNIPGKTNFTRDSEIENAETSAVGRALVMAGIPSKRVSSDTEVEAKQTTGQPSDTIDQATVKALQKLFASPAQALATARDALANPDLPSLRVLTREQAIALTKYVERGESADLADASDGYGS